MLEPRECRVPNASSIVSSAFMGSDDTSMMITPPHEGLLVSPRWGGRSGRMSKSMTMMPGQSGGISRRSALSVDALPLAVGYIGDGQADGPYPGMYDYWWIRHLHNSSLGLQKRACLAEEYTP